MSTLLFTTFVTPFGFAAGVTPHLWWLHWSARTRRTLTKKLPAIQFWNIDGYSNQSVESNLVAILTWIQLGGLSDGFPDWNVCIVNAMILYVLQIKISFLLSFFGVDTCLSSSSPLHSSHGRAMRCRWFYVGSGDGRHLMCQIMVALLHVSH